MFAGIIERVCEVAAVRPAGDAVRLEVELGELLDGLELGASVAINGVCLTLAERRGSAGWAFRAGTRGRRRARGAYRT